MVEQGTHKPFVGGSNPPSATNPVGSARLPPPSGVGLTSSDAAPSLPPGRLSPRRVPPHPASRQAASRHAASRQAGSRHASLPDMHPMDGRPIAAGVRVMFSGRRAASRAMPPPWRPRSRSAGGQAGLPRRAGRPTRDPEKAPRLPAIHRANGWHGRARARGRDEDRRRELPLRVRQPAPQPPTVIGTGGSEKRGVRSGPSPVRPPIGEHDAPADGALSSARRRYRTRARADRPSPPRPRCRRTAHRAHTKPPHPLGILVRISYVGPAPCR